MAENELQMDELWQDFYRTLKPRKPKNLVQLERDRLIHVAWLYDLVAQSGTTRPVDELAKELNCCLEEAGDLVTQCIDARLLCAPKRGAFRCQLSVIAQRMLREMKLIN